MCVIGLSCLPHSSLQHFFGRSVRTFLKVWTTLMWNLAKLKKSTRFCKYQHSDFFQICNFPLLSAADWHAKCLEFFWPGTVGECLDKKGWSTLHARSEHITNEKEKCQDLILRILGLFSDMSYTTSKYSELTYKASQLPGTVFKCLDEWVNHFACQSCIWKIRWSPEILRILAFYRFAACPGQTLSGSVCEMYIQTHKSRQKAGLPMDVLRVI